MKLISIIITLVLSTQVHAAKKFYKWTDQNGNTHYTEKKPKNKDTKEVKIFANKSKPQAVTQEKNAPETNNTELTPEQRATIEFNNAERRRVQALQDRENCKIARMNKSTLENTFNRKITNPATGQIIINNTPEARKQLQVVNNKIRELCK